MSILVVAEHNNNIIKDNTLHALTAAVDLNNFLKTDIKLLILGFNCQETLENAKKLPEISEVLLADAKQYQYGLAEEDAALIASIAKDFSHFIFANSSFGKNLAPRLAAILNIPMLSEVNKFIDLDIYQRAIYAGNAVTKVKVNSEKLVMTIRASAFSANTLPLGGGPRREDGGCLVTNITPLHPLNISKFINFETTKSLRPELGSSKIVVAGGRGLQSKENFKLIEELADKLHAAIGASRAAVDAGFISNDYQVGQTGKNVAPELYIAIGISGAIQHLSGMKDSKIIVAINKDPKAPIFEIANYGLIADLFIAVPELCQKLDAYVKS